MKSKNLILVFISLLVLSIFFSCSNSSDLPKGNKVEENLKIIKVNPATWTDWNNGKLVSTLKEKKIDISWYTDNNNWSKEDLEINSPDGLRGLAWLVNHNKDNFYDKTIELVSQADGNKEFYIGDIPWIPIGEGSRTSYSKADVEVELPGFEYRDSYIDDANIVYRFCGTFDGGKDNGIVIKGLTNLLRDESQNFVTDSEGNYVNGYHPMQSRIVASDDNNRFFSYGLFGLVRGESVKDGINAVLKNGIIKNIALEDVKIQFDGIVTGRDDNDVENPNFVAIVRTSGSIIGQTRYGFKLENASASGSLDLPLLKDIAGGGLVGRTGGQMTFGGQELTKKIEIDSCVNNVEVNAYYSGGIIGRIQSVEFVEIKNCENNANIGKLDVDGDSSYMSGGLIGEIINDEVPNKTGEVHLFNLKNNENTNIYGSYYNGGIVGGINDGNAKLVSITDCINYTAIGDEDYSYWSAGIVAHLSYTDALQANNLINYGDIKSERFAGGIIGNLFRVGSVDLVNLTVGSKDGERPTIVTKNKPNNSVGIATAGTFVSLLNPVNNLFSIKDSQGYLTDIRGRIDEKGEDTGEFNGIIFGTLRSFNPPAEVKFENVVVDIADGSHLTKINSMSNNYELVTQEHFDAGSIKITVDDASCFKYKNSTEGYITVHFKDGRLFTPVSK